MNKSIFFWGLIGIIISVVGWYAKGDYSDIKNNGKLIQAKIISMSSPCNRTKGVYNAKLVYKDLVFNKQITSGFCEKYRVGDYVNMLYIEGDDWALFETEDVKGEYIALIIFFVVGIFMVITSFFYKGELDFKKNIANKRLQKNTK
jgi:hypothetical protein